MSRVGGARDEPASAPLFRDPVHDGASDPTLIRDRATGELVMLYTQRRARHEGPGVEWVHGSRIGVARRGPRPEDEWRYEGVLEGLEQVPGREETHWAPEVIAVPGGYRMYLTVIAGAPDRWEGHPRAIVEYRSDDLRTWTRIGPLPLASDRVIDACVARGPDGVWRLWYKNEADDSTTWMAESDDLQTWRDGGRVIGGRPHEGPTVFALGGWWWMLVDEWRGMAVHRSSDAVTWHRQGGPDAVVLGPAADPAAARPLDGEMGRHGAAFVEGPLAALVYFTHPHWDGAELGSSNRPEARTSVVQAAALRVADGVLHVDRDAPLDLR